MRLLKHHLEDLRLDVFLYLGLGVAALRKPVVDHSRLRPEHHNQVKEALREEVAAVMVDNLAARGHVVVAGLIQDVDQLLFFVDDDDDSQQHDNITHPVLVNDMALPLLVVLERELLLLD